MLSQFDQKLGFDSLYNGYEFNATNKEERQKD